MAVVSSIMAFVLVTPALAYRLGLTSSGKNLTTWSMNVSPKTKGVQNNAQTYFTFPPVAFAFFFPCLPRSAAARSLISLRSSVFDVFPFLPFVLP
jgi:hypothetical protein